MHLGKRAFILPILIADASVLLVPSSRLLIERAVGSTRWHAGGTIGCGERAMKVVEVEQVTKRFGEVMAVDGVSFEVEQGQIISLLGPSGCGKTTTLRLIAGFETPNAGQVRISGEDMYGKRPYERNVGLLFQDYALFPHMTVEQNVGYGLRHRGFKRSAIPQRIAEMLDLVKLTGLEKRRPAHLSGGQQQRVALARALATQPRSCSSTSRCRRLTRSFVRSCASNSRRSSVWSVRRPSSSPTIRRRR